MKLMIFAVGRLKAGPERELVARYHERLGGLGKSLGLSGPFVTELNESPARSADARKAQEADGLLEAITSDTVAIRFDERGKVISSEAFAEMIRTRRDNGVKSISFLIGGADGLHPDIADKAPEALSFGAMTIPHQLVRVLLMEQLYRTATLLSGHPYHRV
jgi:23S rRNA (pseudouridine1915-N3)-methyltransferase